MFKVLFPPFLQHPDDVSSTSPTMSSVPVIHDASISTMDWALDELLTHLDTIPTEQQQEISEDTVFSPPPPVPPTNSLEQYDYLDELDKLLRQPEEPQQHHQQQQQDFYPGQYHYGGHEEEQLASFLLPPPEEPIFCVDEGAFQVTLPVVLPPPYEYQDTEESVDEAAAGRHENFTIIPPLQITDEEVNQCQRVSAAAAAAAAHPNSLLLQALAAPTLESPGWASRCASYAASTSEANAFESTAQSAKQSKPSLSIEPIWNSDQDDQHQQHYEEQEEKRKHNTLSGLTKYRPKRFIRARKQHPELVESSDGGVGCSGTVVMSSLAEQLGALQPCSPMLTGTADEASTPTTPEARTALAGSSGVRFDLNYNARVGILPPPMLAPPPPPPPLSFSSSTHHLDIDSGIESVDSLSPPDGELSPACSPACRSLTPATYTDHASVVTASMVLSPPPIMINVAKKTATSVLSSILSQEPEPTKSSSLLTSLLNGTNSNITSTSNAAATVPAVPANFTSITPLTDLLNANPPPTEHLETPPLVSDATDLPATEAKSMKVIAINPHDLTLSKEFRTTSVMSPLSMETEVIECDHQGGGDKTENVGVDDYLQTTDVPIRSTLEDYEKTATTEMESLEDAGIVRPLKRKRPASNGEESSRGEKETVGL
jgi:hypothetical protein